MDKPHLLDPHGLDLVQPSTGAEPGTKTTDPMPIDMLCRRCGERGGNWTRGIEVKLGDAIAMASNQRVALAADESGHFIYSHLCVDSIGIDLPGVGLVSSPEVPSVCAGRESAVGVGERSPDPDGVHEMSLHDRFRASLAREELPAMSFEITPEGAAALAKLAQPDYRAIAAELLSALYTMIGKHGMPTEPELATEIRCALEHAEAAKVDEVIA